MKFHITSRSVYTLRCSLPRQYEERRKISCQQNISPLVLAADVISKPLNSAEWTLHIPKDLPVQPNSFDCGVWVCLYADLLVGNSSNLPHNANVDNFRKQMLSFVKKLGKEKRISRRKLPIDAKPIVMIPTRNYFVEIRYENPLHPASTTEQYLNSLVSNIKKAPICSESCALNNDPLLPHLKCTMCKKLYHTECEGGSGCSEDGSYTCQECSYCRSPVLGIKKEKHSNCERSGASSQESFMLSRGV